MCFTGVLLENKHFVREWGQRHQKNTPKGPQKHTKIIEKTNHPILNFEGLFLIKTTCFMGAFLEKGHSVREWDHFQIFFFIFSFYLKTGLKKEPPKCIKMKKNNFGAYLKTV